MGNPKSHVDGYRDSGNVIKNAGTRTQAKADKKLTEALQVVDQKTEVLSMICNGRTIQETAAYLEVSTTKIRSLISELLASRHEAIADHAEYVYDVNYMRLEHLFGKAMVAAFDRKAKDGTLLPPSVSWANLALSFIKEQNRMSELQSRNHVKPPDENDPAKPNVHIYARTIVAGDEMFKVAQESMEDVFMDKHKHRLTATGEDEVGPEELLLMQLDNPVGKSEEVVVGTAYPVTDGVVTDKVASLTNNFSKLEQKINSLSQKDDDEHGES